VKPAPAAPASGFSGAGGAAVSRAALLALQVGTAIALSRLLPPADFGLFAMVSVLGSCAILAASLGLAPVLVQRPDLDERDVGAALGLSLLAGAALCAAFVLGAPALAAFYGHPEIVPLAHLQGLAVLAWTAGDVPRALLSRRLAVPALLRQELAAGAIATGVSLPLAVAGAGATAIAALSLAGGVASSWLAFRAAAPGARPRVEVEPMRRLLAAGLSLTGLNLLTYWARNFDQLLIGKLAGEHALGLYSRAFQVMLQPLWQLSGLVTAFLLPGLARLQHAPERARAAYLEGQALLAAAALPVLAGSLVLAPDLVPAVLGERWTPLVPILQVLLVAGVVQVPMMLVGPALTSHGRNALLFRWGLATAPPTMVALALGASWRTAEAVALAYLLVQATLCVPTVRLAARTLGFRLRDVARALEPAAGCTLAMAVLVGALVRLLAHEPRPVRLALALGAGAAAYVVLSWRAGLWLPAVRRAPPELG
jgi:O-antigen/teichoic acid export membrane protein